MQIAVAVIAMLVGAAFCFGGFRFFLLLLPLWAFVGGFNVGTDAMSAIFGDGTFATVTSWVVGLIVAVVFAVLSYLYYYLAVALLGGLLGYAIGAGAWGLIGNETGLIAFVIGIVVGAVFAIGTLLLNVPKYLVIVTTAFGGAATILAGWFVLVGIIPTDAIQWSAIGEKIAGSLFYLIVWVVLAGAGMLIQAQTSTFGTDRFELERESYRF